MKLKKAFRAIYDPLIGSIAGLRAYPKISRLQPDTIIIGGEGEVTAIKLLKFNRTGDLCPD